MKKVRRKEGRGRRTFASENGRIFPNRSSQTRRYCNWWFKGWFSYENSTPKIPLIRLYHACLLMREKLNQPWRIFPLQPVPLAPFLVQKLLELLMSNKLFVTVKNGDVKVGVGVTGVGACLEKGLNLQKQMTLRLEVFCEFEFAGHRNNLRGCVKQRRNVTNST